MMPTRSLNFCLSFFLAFTSLNITSATKQQQEVNLGTTLLAICYKDGVVVGADTRTSVGSYVSNRYADKIFPILNSAVICRSGSAADTQYLADQVYAEFQARYYRYGGEKPTVRHIAYLLRSLVTENMSASLICAGCQEGKGLIYSIAPNGSLLQEEQGFAVSGSGSTFILGHIDDKFRNDMDEQDAVDFVVNAIRLAIDRDGSSGGFVRVHVVNQAGSKVSTVYPDHNKSIKTINQKAHQLTGFAAPRRNSK